MVRKIKTFGGDEMVLMTRGKSAQGAVMKAVKDGLDADIGKCD